MSQTKAQLIDPVDGTIVNADINASAAIAGSKISPDFGSQAISTTGTGSSLGRLRISNVNPFIELVDTNNNSDFSIRGASGNFIIRDDTNAASRLSIDSSGLVGIGTSSPASLLHIESSSAPTLRIDDSDTSGAFLLQQDGANGSALLSSAGTFSIGVSNDNAASTLTFLTRNNERLRIASDGLVGIGTTSPANELVINKSGSAANCKLEISQSGGGGGTSEILFSDAVSGRGRIFYDHGSNPEGLKFEAAGTQTLIVTTGGNVGIGTTSPSELLQVAGTLECNNIKFLTANKFETSANVFEGKGTNGARLRSALSEANTPSFSNSDDTDSGMFLPGSNVLGLSTGGSEALRIDANQHVLINQSASVNTQVGTPPLQVTNAGADVAMFRRNSNDGGGPYLSFVKERSGAIVADDDLVGAMAFLAHDGTDLDSYAAQIKVEIDGTPGANVTPGRLSFHTSAASANRTTERVRIDKEGAFMVGTTSGRTAEFLHPDGFSIRGDVKGQIQNTVTDSTCMLLNRDGTDGQVLGFRKEGSGIGEIGVTGGSIYFQFGSTGSASHRLDDYEEGTFTPLLSDNISSGTANSYQNQSGHFTKIGNIVHIIGAVRADDISNLTSSNNLCLRGLPFAASDVTSGSGEPDMLHITFMNNLTSVSRGLVYGRVENGVSAVNIGFPTTTGQFASNLLISQINSGGNATYFSFSATYRTG